MNKKVSEKLVFVSLKARENTFPRGRRVAQRIRIIMIASGNHTIIQ